MRTGDFLKKCALTSLCECIDVTGVACEIQTNGESILQAARACFSPWEGSFGAPELSIRFWVDPDGKTQAPWPKPYFRGSGHLIFGGFDSENSLLIDLLRRRVLGRFSAAFAADIPYWKSVVFPRILTAVGSSIGLTELHCGCVSRDGFGLVLAGEAGAGKSTTTLALVQAGFSFVSEDWTYFSLRHGRLFAWGLPTGVKLLPDAIAHFDQLKKFETVVTLNGELAYRVDPVGDFGLRREHSCKPASLIFLERQRTDGCEISEMGFAEAEARLQSNLMAASPQARSLQLETIRKVVEQGCWRLRFGESPAKVALALQEFHAKQGNALAPTPRH